MRYMFGIHKNAVRFWCVGSLIRMVNGTMGEGGGGGLGAVGFLTAVF